MSRIVWIARRRLRRALLSAGAVVHHGLGCSPQSAILILGHMRSGSTLLLHLLLGHPEIIGCGERNTSYTSSRDLDRLAVEARVRLRSPLRRFRYAADQINHTRFTPTPAVLDDPRVRVLFLVREPVATVASILAVARRFYPDHGWTTDRAVAYYLERLTALSRLADGLAQPSRASFLTHADLVQHPDDTLQRLQSFLALDGPLSPRYELQAFTGTSGDPMDGIRTGHVDPDRPQRRIELPHDVSAALQRAHDSCLATMRALEARSGRSA